MNNSFSETYFVDGGTLDANTPSYVDRPADDELIKALLRGEYCYLLTPRQMGKSSLMTRTSQRLKEHNIKIAVVDLQGMGTKHPGEFYASLLSRIRRGLKLSVDIDEWMKKKSNVGFGQMFSDFIQDVVLTEIAGPVVIFLDEVDYLIGIDFRDDFFASIRAMYNARAQYSEFNRISFVLLGVASPADLISEPTRTPFNIGHAIPLQELSLEDATPLQEGLEQVCPGEAKRILGRIFYWTSGHPYLTQKICKTIAETGKADWSNPEVDDLVHRLFLADEAHKETNLKFIQDRILDSEQFAQMLNLYKRVRRTRIRENGQSILQNQLMLSGLLTARGGYLEVRNRIYQTVFNDRWISKNIPKNWQRIAMVTLGAIVTLLLVVFSYDFVVGMRLDGDIAGFYRADSSSTRLSHLANIYRSKGILSNTDTGLSASQLFYGLERQDQLNIFTDSSIRFEDAEVQDDLVTVIRNLYVTVAYVDSDNDNTNLLRAMRDALDKIKENAASTDLRDEINIWFDARREYINQDYGPALAKYNEAIGSPPKNRAIVYERALVYIALADQQDSKQEPNQDSSENYANALRDLDTTIGLAEESTQQDRAGLQTSAISTLATSGSVETATFEVTRSPVATLVFGPSTPSSQSTLPTATSTPGKDQFEDRFSTRIQIITAVESLISNNPGLQAAIQPNGDVIYANLQSAGLVKKYPTPTIPVVACDRAQFVVDVNIPDGTVLAPGASFTKTWRLKNVGSCEWTTSYQLVFSSGEQMGAVSSAAFPQKVAKGQTVDISINMTAPSAAGSHRSYWIFKNANGSLFGIGPQGNSPWWVDIKVGSASTTLVAYDFTADAASATWSSGAGDLTFPGTDGDAKGFALKLDKPNFESGVVTSQPGLLVSPEQITNGFIQVRYPDFTVRSGDRFQTTIGCQAGASSCYVAYRLDYQTGTNLIQTLWTFRQKFEGVTYNVNLDLSPLAGKDVKFILYVSAYGSPVGDRALWGNPVIARLEASPVPVMITPSPNVAYDFAANACAGTWYSGTGELPCPGIDGDAQGFVLNVSNPQLESGATDPRPGLITFPSPLQGALYGYIQGSFPPFEVQNGDRFRSIVNCESGATNCYVAFRLDYQTGSDPIKTLWGPLLERYEGRFYNVDVDLSSLAGKDVKFILIVLSAGVNTGDRALWVGPHIYRVDASSALPTPTPK